MQAVRIVFISAMTVAVGCVDELPGESTTTQAVVAENKIAINKIAINKIAINKIAINKIAINKIAINGVLSLDPAAVAELVSTEDGEAVLEYLISCAFPAGTTLEGPGAAGTRTYEGNVGLAPKWAQRRLTRPEQGWVSACMLARVNLEELPLLISLRGPHPGLETTAGEVAEFDIEEGAFYGDIFTGDQPIEAYACAGIQEGPSADLDLRRCTTEDPDHPGQSLCWDDASGVGIRFVGACARACEQRRGANANNPFYERCHDREADHPRRGWPGSDRHDQVITVFVR